MILTSLSSLQNDISDVLDLTFSIDADEEKLILYERTEVIFCPSFHLDLIFLITIFSC